MSLRVKHIPIIQEHIALQIYYILVWNILIVRFTYLDLNWNRIAVSVFYIIDTVCFMPNIITY